MKKIKTIVLSMLIIILAAFVTACTNNTLYLSKKDITLEVGASETIIASIKEGGAVAGGVVWSSDKAEIASVTDGKITGVAKGTAVITATLNNKSVNVNVTVNDTLGDYKTSKKTELDTYAAAKGETNYTAAKWTTLQAALTAGKTAIDGAADTAAVDQAVTTAKTAIDTVSTKVAASIDIGDISGIIAETQPVVTNVYGQAATFDESGYQHVDITLNKGDAEYSNVRFEVSIDTSASLQLFARDTSGNWYNVIETGWGPPQGFAVATATTRFYAVGLKSGTHTVTVKLVDVTNSNSTVLTKTAQVTIIKPLSIEIGNLSGTIWETDAVATTSGLASSFNHTLYNYVDITLNKGVAEYTNVRFQVSIDTPAALQLFGQDTTGKWYNVMETGWGPPQGFAVATATTRFYAVGLKAGTHTITVRLIDLNNSNNVILTETSQIDIDTAR